MSDVERELRDLGDRTGREVTYGSVPARRIVRRARLRRSVALALPTAAAVALAAVVYPIFDDIRGRSGGAPADLAAVARATQAAKTARVELEVAMEMDGRRETMRAVGEVDFDRRRTHLRMESSGLAGSVQGEMISIGDTTYQRTGGSKWIEYEVSSGAFGTGSGPADVLPYLEKMSDDVTNLGVEELDGVTVTHYRAALHDFAAEEIRKASIRSDVEIDPMDVWVDSLGRLRKLTLATAIDDEAGQDASMEMTMRLWDFGIPVDVVAPDPKDVTDDRLLPGESGGHELEMKVSDGGGTPGDASFVYVHGEAGPSAPHVLVIRHEGDPPLVCAQSLPEGSAGAVLVDETSGRDLDLDQAFLQSVGGDPPGGCIDTHDSRAVAETLLEDPSRYTLHVEVEGAEDVRIPLETVRPFG